MRRRGFPLGETLLAELSQNGHSMHALSNYSPWYRLIEDGAVRILQPDLSKSGGITEGLRIAALAAAAKLPIHPHSSMTGLNHAATIHFLAAIGNGGYFEGDVSRANRFRDELVDNPGGIDAGGCVWPLEKPGLGLEVDERFIERHPPIEGPGYI